MKKSSVIGFVTCMIAAIIGCQSAPKEPVSVDDAIMELAQPLVMGALKSPCFLGGKRQVMAIRRIQNNTMSLRGGDIEMMESQVSSMFSDSGRVLIQARPEPGERRGAGSLVPSLILSGDIAQRNVLAKDGKRHCEFTLTLKLTDSASGMQIWKGRRSVVLIMDAKDTIW